MVWHPYWIKGRKKIGQSFSLKPPRVPFSLFAVSCTLKMSLIDEPFLLFFFFFFVQYAGINIGPVHKRDVMKASAMLEHDNQWVMSIFLLAVTDLAVLMAPDISLLLLPSTCTTGTRLFWHLMSKWRERRRIWRTIWVWKYSVRT